MAAPIHLDGAENARLPIKAARFFRGLGPGLITASVVIGPGSIVVSSRLGASAGYSLIWAVLIAGSFMLLFTAIATRIGVCNEDSLLTVAARRYGRWLSVLVGLSAFLVTSSFQMGNYLACAAALELLTGAGGMVWMIAVGVAALLFIFCARRLYRVLERLMTALVAFMLLAFLVNLAVARPSFTGIAAGLVPREWPLWPEGMTPLLIAMVATTFSVIAALYQSTLAQAKGWREADYREAVGGSLRGVSALLLASLMILITSAAVLQGAEIRDASHLASQLEPLLGTFAVVVFALGFLAAAFSSTVVNAMIGGGLLADGLGLKADTDSLPTRLLTALAMLTGWSLGLYFFATEEMVNAVVWAQRTTILAVPLAAAVLIVMANDHRVVGRRRNGWIANLWAGVALLALIGMSLYRLIEILS